MTDFISIIENEHKGHSQLSKTVDLKICGGCCGTDSIHLRAIAQKLSLKNLGN
ncbi:MAG: hypothetical protein LBL82_04125 [Oscillospiraceae bacterium]|jgi:methionine synthase I (cobalamin-dependent)|nr:hypothetical protein [Oscillospiraceae bacterium]